MSEPLKVNVIQVSVDNGRALGYYPQGGYKMMVEFKVTPERGQELIVELVGSEYGSVVAEVEPGDVRSVRRGERFNHG